MRRIRADSAESAVKAMVDASKGPLEPPDHIVLREGDRPFWDGIIRARARDEWLENDLIVVAQLARVQADIERESALLDTEGAIATTERGTPVANPRVAVLEKYAQRQLAYRRDLRMGGRVMGDPAKDAQRRKIQLQAEGALDELAGEELLAT